MPFMLYNVAETTGSRTYDFMRIVPLAGNTGPLAHIQRTRNTKRAVPFGWHAPAKDIVAALGGLPNQAIIIDLKPNVALNVSLCLLRDVWGFSDHQWTPLALRLESLYTDWLHPEPSVFKASFNDENAQRTLIGEFLYVQGGVDGGTWNWGRVGSVNGALLWPAAFDYLSTQLRQALHE